MAVSAPLKSLSSVKPSERFSLRVRAVAIQPSGLNGKTQESKKVSRFAFHGRDEKGTVARIVGYGPEVCSKFEHVIKLDCVYVIERASLKTVDSRFRLNGFPYDIILSVFSKINAVEDDGTITHVDRSVVSTIDEIADLENGAQLNISGYIMEVGDFIESESESAKRHIVIGDTVGDKISLTLWNDMARLNRFKKDDVVVAYRVKKSNYEGCSLMATTTSEFKVEPADVPEVEAIKLWLHQKKESAKKRKTTEDGEASGSSSKKK